MLARLLLLASLTAFLAPAEETPKRTASFNIDALTDGDIDLISSTARFRIEAAGGELDFSLGTDLLRVGYEPNPLVDIVGRARDLNEETYRLGLTYKRPISLAHTLGAGVSYSDGYSDYRSLWLDEYYRQQFGEFGSYTEADPSSIYGSANWRWQYSPLVGFLEVDLSGGQERIPPGYERIVGGELERGREFLDTTTASVSSENVINRRTRARNTITGTDTTGRDFRVGLQSQWNYAITEHLVSRASIAYTNEGNEFKAYTARVGFEYDIDDTLFIGLFYRYYEDDGQLDQSLLIDSSTPPLETHQIQVSLRKIWSETLSGRIYAGYYLTSYEEPATEIAPFGNLYNEREWLRLGLSLTHSF